MKPQDLQTRLNQARKSGDKQAMSLLQVILGDISTLKARNNKEPSEDQVDGMIRSLRDKNNETLALLAGKGREDDEVRLKNENTYLTSLLPTTLTVEQIVAELAEAADVKTAKNDGAAVGLAMKFLKPKGLKVLGDDVKKAVEQIRRA